MSDSYIVYLPKLGESIVSARIVRWLKKEGDTVALDEAIVEVSTDKVNSEIPSPVAGVLTQILVTEEQEVAVGEPLAQLHVGVSIAKPVAKPIETVDKPSISPAVLQLARSEGLCMNTVSMIQGSGEGGRITKKDVEKYLETRTSRMNCESEERIALDGARKAIAENMVRSFYQAPHASLVLEVDFTHILKQIAQQKEYFFQVHGVKLTVTSLILHALAAALKQYPLLNASLEEQTIVVKKYINIGVAVHVEDGLMVPVIKNCETKNLIEIAQALSDLSHRARDKKLYPDDVRAGSVTLTNFGMGGALIGIPIIRYPEVAIIGIGKIEKKVMVKDEAIALRDIGYMTLTFDHRLVDGIYGCKFLETLKKNLEQYSLSR